MRAGSPRRRACRRRGDPSARAIAGIRPRVGTRRRIQRVSASERELEHQRAAKELAALGAAPEVVASHLLRVPPRGEPWVAQVLREAGLLATRRGDADSAVAYLRRALKEGPTGEDRARLLWELGRSKRGWTPRPPSSGARGPRASRGPLPRALAAECLRARCYGPVPPSEAVAVAQRAVAELQGTHTDQRRALEAIECYAVFFGGAHVPDCAARLARVRAAGVRPPGREDAGRRGRLGLGARGRLRPGLLGVRARGPRRWVVDRPRSGIRRRGGRLGARPGRS